MRILVACEYSGEFRRRLRDMGHDAYSCDLIPSDDNSPYHITGDVIPYLSDPWDGLIAHPTCTYLTNSGVRWLSTEKGRWDKMVEGAKFFRKFLDQDHIPKIAVENPVMHPYAKDFIGRNQTQVVQPYWFGDRAAKATCWWLKGLEPLEKTDYIEPPKRGEPEYEEWQAIHRTPPGPDRWKIRSKTFPGMAQAGCDQWFPIP